MSTDAISVDALRALSPEGRAARSAAVAALPPEAEEQGCDEGPGPAMSVDAWRALSPAAKASRAAALDDWEKRQTATAERAE